MPRPNVNSVRRAYEECTHRARLWLRDKGLDFEPAQFDCKPISGTGEIVIRTRDAFHFRRWPERPRSNKKLDILATIEETVSPNMECIKSSVRIVFCRVKNEKAEAVESIRYDANTREDTENGSTFSHPVCHAQLDTKVLPRPKSFDYEIDGKSIRNRCKNIRIPTAHVSLPGLFVILTAERIESVDWKRFIDHCEAVFGGMPKLGDGNSPRLIQKHCTLSPQDWYVT